MTAPKNPRITISPEAFKILSIQAALNGKSIGDLASQLIVAGCPMAAQMVVTTRGIEGERKNTTEGEDQKTEENLSVYQKEKKEGNSIFTYWQAKWIEKGKKKIVYLGSVNKMSQDAAWKKARDLKAQSQIEEQPQ